MRQISLWILIFVFSCMFFQGQALAAKKFVPKQSAPAAVRPAASGGTGKVPAVVRYRNDKHAIFLSFSQFSGIESASYSLTYTSNGISQGVGGSITSANDPSAQRELYFGTCSHGVCTPHYTLANIRLLVIVKYSNGKTASKVFRMKAYH